jgi:cellulose biosynthesis protein BcsQ
MFKFQEMNVAITVSFLNMKGGVGKTTLCLNMAWYAAGQKIWLEGL